MRPSAGQAVCSPGRAVAGLLAEGHKSLLRVTTLPLLVLKLSDLA